MTMKYKVTLNGRVYEVEVEAGQAMLLAEYEAIAPAAPAAPAAPVAAASAAAPAPAAAPAAPVGGAVTAQGDVIGAPMPGTILGVNVKEGDVVAAGQVLCILEAMKMENEIKAPNAGTVKQVLVGRGQSVETGAPLVVIG